MLATVTILIISLLSSSSAAGIGKAWDISPSRAASPEETTIPAWPRLDLSAFEVRSISGIGRLANREYPPPTKTISHLPTDPDELESFDESDRNHVANEADDMETPETPEILYDHPIFKSIFKSPGKDVEMLPDAWEKSRRRGRTGRNRGYCSESTEDPEESFIDSEEHPRVRRNAAETQMEKISGSKNVREPRLGSPESWSTQPLSVEFRHRTNLEGMSAEEESSRSPVRDRQAPQVDFVTTNRRSFESRESRDLPVSRSYDDGAYRPLNTLRDYDLPYSRGYYYPDHFRTEREYFVRGLNEPVALFPDRYRIEDFDMYRNRPTPKPKRIIYYATLPEVVRKPVDLRTYPRPHDNIGRASGSSMNRDGIYKRIPDTMDSRYRYRNHPYGGYDNYDNYMKRSSYTDRPFIPYNERIDEDRYREQDLDHASFKEASKTEEGMNGSSAGTGEHRGQEKLPWPIQIGTEINIKDNQRVSGRKIFGQHQDFERFRPSTRIDREDNGEILGLGDDRN